MNSDSYNLNDAYVSVGGNQLNETVNNFARKTVGDHYIIASIVIIALAIIVIVLLIWGTKEKFNPTATMRMQQRDGTGEGLQPDRGTSAFAQTVQTNGIPAYDPSKGNNAWQVLNSSDFNCNARQPAGEDAWSWMGGVVKENMGDKPSTDNDFSRILAGQ